MENYRNCRKATVAALVTIAVAALFAGNDANPDAIELLPLPMPVEFKSDIDRSVPFDETVTVTVDCPDASAVVWADAHFKEWYGEHSPKAVAGAVGAELKSGDEAYAVSAGADGVKIKARTLAGVRWALYSIRQLAIAKRGTFKTAGRIIPTLKISDAPHLSFR